MKRYRLEDYHKGWVVGNFVPSILELNTEVALQRMPKGVPTKDHVHKEATEITIVVSGALRINGNSYGPNDICVLEPGEISRSEFLEDTIIVVIKTPSVPLDKYEV